MTFKDYLFETIQSFKIPVKIRTNYEITNNLKDLENWKAKIYLSNSGGPGSLKVKKQKILDSVGYIAISLDSNILVPIARADEHQNGYELLDYLIQRKLIPNEEYVTIFPLSTDYVYNESDKLRKLQAYKKYLNYGGEDFDVGSMGSNYMGTAQDFINRNGNISYDANKLAPHGQKIVDTLRHITKEYLRFRSIDKNHHEPSESDMLVYIEKIMVFLKLFDKKYYPLLNYDNEVNGAKFDQKYIDEILKKISELKDDNNRWPLNYMLIGKYILSANGFKNRLHMNLKHMADNKTAPEYYQSIFGNIEHAIQEFNSLGDL